MYQDYDPIPCDEQFPEKCDCLSQRKYARILRNQLIRIFGTPPEGISFKSVFNNHDFGGYITLRISVIKETREALNYFKNIDEEFPTEWDQEALREITNTEF